MLCKYFGRKAGQRSVSTVHFCTTECLGWVFALVNRHPFQDCEHKKLLEACTLIRDLIMCVRACMFSPFLLLIG